MPYDPVKDFTPVIYVALAANVLIVNPSLPAKSMPELVAYAKANPGKLTRVAGQGDHGSPRRRAVQAGGRHRHHARALSGRSAGLQDVIGGQVSMMFDIVRWPASTSRPARCGRSRHVGATLPGPARGADHRRSGAARVQGGAWWASSPGRHPEGDRRVAQYRNPQGLRVEGVRERLTDQGLTFYLGSPSSSPSTRPRRPSAGAA